MDCPYELLRFTIIIWLTDNASSVYYTSKAGDEVKAVKDGALCNVAPTILKLMGIPQPAAMTAEPLI